jgi:hypothetical protein
MKPFNLLGLGILATFAFIVGCGNGTYVERHVLAQKVCRLAQTGPHTGAHDLPFNYERCVRAETNDLENY